ncbi:MAG TPA: hypothetical protein VNA57_00070 [Acidimicrobiales bacterium]|nr:hypothetical protein [Acidimicrobiales bacterium]
MPEPRTDPRLNAVVDLLADASPQTLAVVDDLLAILAGGQGPEELVVRARRFEVTDRRGRVRAVLGDLSPASEDLCFPGLSLHTAEGTERLFLVLTAQGPTLNFALEGNDALVLGVDDPGTEAVRPGPYLALLDREGQVAAGWRIEHAD